MQKKSMSLWLVAGCMLAFLSARPVTAQQYQSYDAMTRTLKSLQKKHPDLIRLSSIGKSTQGREIWLLRLAREQGVDPDSRGAFLLVSNIEGDYLVGSELIVRLAEEITESRKDLLEDHTIYAVPRLNPDGAERFFDTVKSGSSFSASPFDEDFDGLVDEDGPEDLDGNGIITHMRVRTVGGNFLPDSLDGRLLKEADPVKGENGVYKVYVEGVDSDGDDRYNEDGPGGVEINRNFPHAYPYYQHNAGLYMTSEPETRALIDFLCSNRNVDLILNYGKHDNLFTVPRPEKRTAPERSEDTGGRRFFRSRKAPTAINPDDHPYFEEISSVYKKIIGLDEIHSLPNPAGAFHQWGYYQYGVLSFSTPVWNVPAEKKEADSTAVRRPGRRSAPRKPVKYEKRLLDWLDAEHIADGFIPWHAYTHPQLGQVEIGGFNPYILYNPPTLPDKLVSQQERFLIYLMGLFPRIELAEFSVTKKADSVYELKAVVRNTGYLPTVTAQGALSRSVKPTLARIEGKGLRLLSGRSIHFLDPLAGSGGSEEINWLIQAKPGSSGTVTVTSEKAGSLVKQFILR